MAAKKKTRPAAPVCAKCAHWELFEGKCWFYWDHKKECSQFRKHSSQEPEYKEDEDHEVWKKTIRIIDQ